MDGARISIITVVYNAEGLLDRTMQSVYKQDYVNLEYIVVDGQSTDGTVDLIKENENWISHWISEADKGIYDAMNKGMDMAEGDYVWFLNAGDELFSEQTVSKLFSGGNPADIYYGDTEKVDQQGNGLGLYSETTHTKAAPGMGWRDWNKGSQVCHQSFVVKKSLAVQFDLTYRYTADIDWEIKCLKAASQIVRSEAVLAKFLIDESGYSKRNQFKAWLDRYRVLQSHFGLIPNFLNHLQILLRALFQRFR